MPKATCQACGLSMPLQILAVHVKSCCIGRSSTEYDSLYDDCCSSPDVSIVGEFSSVNSVETTGTSTSRKPSCDMSELSGVNSSVAANSNSTSVSKGSCPVCLMIFPLDYLEVHASLCGERVEDTHLITEGESQCNSESESLEGVLQAITAAVSTTDGYSFDITVSRHNMLERVLSQWQRQKKSNPAKQLKVVFLGEAGIDTGALRKELLSGMMEGIEKRFFEGDRHGKRPKYSISDLDHFKTIGEIMAVSLAQGGPAPNVLAVWCYKFLCSGSLKFEDLDKTALGDDQHIELISKCCYSP
ncbi:hypothetical protein AMEX_G2656 [Astyanax mexicanus]|uniref:HECT domain-containing protein n=1 Tax=Astyanax mexicanus TaxID=7994 RepID=A0A8T2MJY9_ASTMX|nr:hypothetical protein AMEX_G2656 [Astyanax mexicanus]